MSLLHFQVLALKKVFSCSIKEQNPTKNGPKFNQSSKFFSLVLSNVVNLKDFFLGGTKADVEKEEGNEMHYFLYLKLILKSFYKNCLTFFVLIYFIILCFFY